MVTGKHEKITWWQRETVRLRGYTIGTAVIGIMVLRQWLSNEEAGYVLMALAAVFGVYGVESSRNRTTPDEMVIKEVVPAAAAGHIVSAKEMVDKAPNTIKDIDNERL